MPEIQFLHMENYNIKGSTFSTNIVCKKYFIHLWEDHLKIIDNCFTARLSHKEKDNREKSNIANSMGAYD